MDVISQALTKLTKEEQVALREYFINCSKSTIGRSQFTSEEDNRLRKLVQTYGACNWACISNEMPGKTARQCRERYKHYLCPNIKNSAWMDEEDEKLRTLYYSIGPKWVEISNHFENRTDVNVKNRWIVLMRKDSKIKYAKNPEPTLSPEPVADFSLDFMSKIEMEPLVTLDYM